MNQFGSRMSAAVKVVEADSANWLVIDQSYTMMIAWEPKLTLVDPVVLPVESRELSSGEGRIEAEA